MPIKASMNAADPTWARMLFAYRWPFAVLATGWVLAGAATRILSNPIPVRIDGGVVLEKVNDSIKVRSAAPLRVAGSVEVANDEAIKVAADEIVVGRAVTVHADRSIPVTARDPIRVKATESIAVTASEAIPVTAPDPILVSTGGPVSAVVDVSSVQTPISVVTEEAIGVKGTLGISRIADPVRVNARGRIFPFQLP